MVWSVFLLSKEYLAVAYFHYLWPESSKRHELNRIITELEHDVDNTQSKLELGIKKMQNFIKDNKSG